MDKSPSPWNVPVAVDDIPDAGLHLELEAPDAVQAALAAEAGLRSVTGLKAAFDVTRRGRAVHVGGRVEASVGQTCVVTLEPIDNPVSEEIDLLFSPDVAPEPETAAEEAHSVGHTAEEVEPPEPLVGGSIDLGAVAAEFLMLGIDPYPRKEGARFQPPPADTEGAHPFAALAALKKPPGGAAS